MLKEIHIGEHEVTMLSNAATPVIYRGVFQEDLLVFLQKMSATKGIAEGMTDMVCKLAYVMTMQAENKKMRDMNFDKFIDWLSEFQPLDFENSAGEILALYTDSGRTLSKSKKG